MDWLKIVYGCMKQYFPEEAKEFIGSEDPTTFIQVRGVFILTAMNLYFIQVQSVLIFLKRGADNFRKIRILGMV